MVHAIGKEDTGIKMTLLPAGHLCWDMVYSNPTVISWFMLQNRHDQ